MQGPLVARMEYRYDSHGRITQLLILAASPGSSVSSATTFTFTAWDMRGRPIAGTIMYPSPLGSCSIAAAFDDSMRSVTTQYLSCPLGDPSGVGLTGMRAKTEMFDVNMFPAQLTAILPDGTSSVTTYIVNSTLEVCK
jgi:hypothetical protein